MKPDDFKVGGFFTIRGSERERKRDFSQTKWLETGKRDKEIFLDWGLLFQSAANLLNFNEMMDGKKLLTQHSYSRRNPI